MPTHNDPNNDDLMVTMYQDEMKVNPTSLVLEDDDSESSDDNISAFALNIASRKRKVETDIENQAMVD